MSVPDEVVTPRSLSLRRVLAGAFTLTWRYRADVIRQAGLPLLMLIAFLLFWDQLGLGWTSTSLYIRGFVYLLLTSWLAIAVHRMVLLDQPGPSLTPQPQSLRRLGVFGLVVIGLFVLFIVLKLMILLLLWSVPFSEYVPAGAERSAPAKPPFWVFLATSSLPFLVIGRLALLMPRVAIDQPTYLHAVWRLSMGNGLKMAVIVGVLPWTLLQFMNLLFRDGASATEIALLYVASALCVVVEVAALSLAYRELSSQSD